MARSTPKRPAPAKPTWPSEENIARHKEYMEQAKDKGLLHPEEEWEERTERGLVALFGLPPGTRLK